nr:Chain 1, Human COXSACKIEVIRUS A21 [Coxsackievirus A21]
GIEDLIDTAIKNALRVSQPPSTQSTEATSGVNSQEVPALTAVETGASGQAIPSDVVETRHVVNYKTRSESCLESFFGRAACVTILSLTNSSKSGEEKKHFNIWNITYTDTVQLRRKLEFFTYSRFDLEMTFVFTENYPSTASGEVRNQVYQIMYIPPGAPRPSSWDDYTWQSSSNPSIFYMYGNAPPRMSIPYVGIANAYSHFYDGFARVPLEGENTDAGDTFYGLVSINDFGVLAVRAVNRSNPHTIHTSVRVYMKPKHIRCWCPRPPRAVLYRGEGVDMISSAILPLTKVDSITTF